MADTGTPRALMRSVLMAFFVALILIVPAATSALSYAWYPQTYSPYAYFYSNPRMTGCGSSYGSCSVGTQHVFAPYTYVNNYPYTNVSASAASYVSPYSYSQPTYRYSYPQYSSYNQGSYNSPRSSYSYPQYTPSYRSGDQYCYSGYGCYPFAVSDPHQWVYDRWTGTWY